WVPLKPGTEGVLALGIAHVIMSDRLRPASAAGRAGSQIDGWSGGLSDYTPAEVEKRTGLAAARIEKLAREFAGHLPAVALVGGAPLAHTNGLFNALGVNALNALVGSIGQPGGIYFTPGAASTEQARSIDKVSAEILSSQSSPVELLLVNDANPVFGTPPAWKVKEALSKVPFIVSFGQFIDETSVLADLILPDHSFLESWVDHVPEAGAKTAVASVAPPAMRPLYQTRSMPDVLLEVSRRLSRPLSPAFAWQTYQEMLADSWTKAQEQGGWWNDSSALTRPVGALGEAQARQRAALRDERPGGHRPPLQNAEFDGDASQYPFHFLPFASQQFFDGSAAHLPWLQELPDVLTTAMWSSWVEINPKTAEELGISQGDLLEIASAHGTLRAPAVVFPGIAPDVIAMPVGQGHETFTRYASGRGANPVTILAPLAEPETGALAWAGTRVRVSKVDGDRGLILFSRGMGMTEHPHTHR
ncbi:MAG: molybdopterin-dependent oxidoreductase, partial [Acidobacteria bacterium]|nr:molybdopterin-dependent oxidoreductase [Acidobacteriota bacterium]